MDTIDIDKKEVKFRTKVRFLNKSSLGIGIRKTDLSNAGETLNNGDIVEVIIRKI